ncbi:Eisosome component PIL1-domain-containing protein [Suillus clintonianus]|uniref:Eisosome component PIL1-domain-containing protein n=1 Tax=Suillus clintonianus TaxID=1904413 RepID=UPI001B860197|nr:Eisosome component PIL1-domain-containing protein [Suillus clintonianus]KAG2154910.1 Eisosome component PIL1-domain-containing protein [Suillus clintonianus]
MSVSSFLSSFADKAQSAINQSPLAGHIPGTSATGQPTANQAAAQGGNRSVALEAFQHQIRSLGQQYTSTTPVQRIITSEKGVAIDCDSFARDAKVQSKELYTWGQSQPEDLKDVTDRLAYLNFVQGSLASSVAIKLDNARAPFKALRDAEAVLAPKRIFRAGLRTQIARIEHNQEKGMERRLPDLRSQLAKAEQVDEPLEKELEILKRKAVRESETQKWDAIREFGEKLVLLSQASKPIIAVLPPIPPSHSNPYTGAQETGAARAALQRALDDYKPGSTFLPAQSGANLSRSDTQSFGESHASELSHLVSNPEAHAGHPGVPITPPPQADFHATDAEKAREASHSPPIDPSTLNLSPSPIPEDQAPISCPTARIADKGSLSPVLIPVAAPTVAETGVPLSAGSSGPGPASGSLRDIHRASDAAGPRSGGLPGNSPFDDLYGQPHETAAEEKSRLERERVLAAGTSAAPAENESAEDEKKRLEREERERVLASQDGENAPGDVKDGDELPPYKPIE